MHKKFEINWIKIRDGCQLGRKMVTHNSKSDLPLEIKKKMYFQLTATLNLCVKFLCMCSSSMASAHLILKQVRQRLRVAVICEEKW